MRLLVMSDVHANWPALEAVIAAESYDALLIGGDLVSYGPHPREVVAFVQRYATLVVRGHQDEAIADGSDVASAPPYKPLAEATCAVHRELLSRDDVLYLGSLPLTGTFMADGRSFFSAHVSPRESPCPRALLPHVPERHLRTEIGELSEDVVLLGHTHIPMIRRVAAQTVVNPGSVGQPRDGNPRASYAIIEDGVPELRRVAYDVDRTIRDLRASPTPAWIAESLAWILRNGRA